MMRSAFAHFSLACHASIGDNPALSENGGARWCDLDRAAQGNRGTRSIPARL